MKQPDKVVRDDSTPVANTRLTTERVPTQQIGESEFYLPYSFFLSFNRKTKKSI